MKDRRSALVSSVLVLMLAGNSAWAQDPAGASGAASGDSAAAAGTGGIGASAGTKSTSTSSGPLLSLPGQRKDSKRKGKRREQKETEGSEAPGRFEADTILKSQYTLDGQPLEVDPD